MLDFNDFYAFKMTSGDNSDRNSNKSVGCGTVIIARSFIG